jgi:hypothetical protein
MNLDFSGVKSMSKQTRRFALILCSIFAIAFLSISSANAQETLGGITGTVTDTSGAVISGATVTLVGDQTKLTRTQTTSATGAYSFVNLPLGTYTLSFTQQGFSRRTYRPSGAGEPHRDRERRTENRQCERIHYRRGNAADQHGRHDQRLRDGQAGDRFGSSAHRLLHRADDSFPGRDAELSGGTGANAGLGNAPVWANGQRDTSNDFLLNGVDARSLFNGKSTSQVLSARIVNATGVSGASSLSAIPVQSSASVYLAIGESMPSPAPESIAGSSREYFDVRRAARLDQRRARRYEHRLRHEQHSWAAPTCTAAPTG